MYTCIPLGIQICTGSENNMYAYVYVLEHNCVCALNVLNITYRCIHNVHNVYIAARSKYQVYNNVFSNVDLYVFGAC